MTADSQNYQSLAVQVARRIGEDIRREKWVNRLPGERILADSLQVSRKTLRKSLAILQHEGVIETRRGRGHEIVVDGQRNGTTTTQLSVGLLAPNTIEHMRPFTALWIDALRSLLIENGLRLATFSGQRFFSGQPEKALARLVAQNPQNSWILAHSNEPIQQWFFEQRVPCVLAGSNHPGYHLPNVDLDYFAVCRHAVGAMLRNGHQRVAFLTKLSQRAGDLESEAGFAAGARLPHYPDVDPVIARHDGSLRSVNRTLTRLFNYGSPPSAILVANPSYYLTTATFLAQRGLRVPEDVSLICRDDDSFLGYLNPVPTRYSCSPSVFAKRMLQSLLVQIRGEPLTQTAVRIEVRYTRGKSLGTLTPQAD